MTLDVAVVGAGPYGLSIASHLRARGVDFRIFGTPMQTWRTEMPQGMFLKSEGFASNLYDPAGASTLAAYCAENGFAYADAGLPISRAVFADYGVAFQRRQVPTLEQQDVVAVAQAPAGFRITLASGEAFDARRVVLAVGISHFAHLPPELAGLPRALVTHSSHHGPLDGFEGREVIVLGAGASALDCAALLSRAGASVRLVARVPQVHFHAPPGPGGRTWIDALRAPQSGLGPGWRSRLCTDAPLLFHAMPEWFRLKVVARHLGPAAGWWTRDMVAGKVAFDLGLSLRAAAEEGGRIRLDLATDAGERRTLTADHVVAATGYRPLVQRLGFLSDALRTQIRTVDAAPVLSAAFESSVPGLYFTGLASANAFGPLVRFAFGADFTARRLSRHLGQVLPRRTGTALRPRDALTSASAA
jgi:Pyridine nucleotide-disulphide oxidoreductase